MDLQKTVSYILRLENAYFFAAAVFDYIQALLANDQLAEAKKALADLKAFWDEYGNKLDNYPESIFFFTLSYQSANIATLEGDFKKVVALAKELKPKFEQRKDRTDDDPALYIVPLKLGFGCFVLREYTEALYWFRFILNDATITIRPDVLGFVRILHLLVQFELQNNQILSYYADSTKRFLTKNEQFYEFEQLFLQLIKQIAYKTHWDSEYESILNKFKESLITLEQNASFEKEYIQQYYLIEWIDSKILKRNFEDLILEKLNKS